MASLADKLSIALACNFKQKQFEVSCRTESKKSDWGLSRCRGTTNSTNPQKWNKKATRLLYYFSFLPAQVLTFAFPAFQRSFSVSRTAVSADFHVQSMFLRDGFFNRVQYGHFFVNLPFWLSLWWLSIKYTFCLKLTICKKRCISWFFKSNYRSPRAADWLKGKIWFERRSKAPSLFFYCRA